jgi:cytochrome b561
MPPERQKFAAVSRALHWIMVVMVLSMLAIGVAMVVSLADYHLLISIHRPLGIAVLILVVIRFINRQIQPLPPFPETMPAWERRIAHSSEITMYALMLVLPLVGWGMLSAAQYPIVLYGGIHLPFILPPSMALYSILRPAHTILAYLFFATIVAHFSGVLFHTLVLRDGLLKRMAP